MRCDKVKELLMTDYVDGEMDAGSRDAVREHLKSCRDCRELEGAVTATKSSIHGIKRAQPPPYLWERIKDALAGEEIKAPGPIGKTAIVLRDLLFGSRYVFARATAVALVILVIVFAGLAVQRHYMSNGMTPQEISSFLSLDINGESAENGLGTEIEEYFL